MTTELENPADQLSTIVVKLFQIAGDTRIESQQKRGEIFLAAHKLQGYSTTLAQKQFTDNTDKYKSAMNEIKNINSGLEQAQNDIEKIVETIKNLGRLVSSVEKLIIALGGIMA